MTVNTYDLFQNVRDDDSCLVYMGHFDDHFTDILIEVNEAAAAQDTKSTRKKVSFLIAECFQNIVRHGSDDHTRIHVENPKMFTIRNLDGIYSMCTSNVVNNNKVSDLERLLTSLNNVSKDELKEIYLNSLENNSYNEAGGAGLGLIEMARRSNRAPDFFFDRISPDFSNFFMQIEIIPKQLTETHETGNILIDQSRELYAKLRDENIVLLRKGNFSQDNVLPLFKLIEANVQREDTGPTIDKKGIYVLIEMLQNVSKHGYSDDDRTDGIIAISQKGEYFQISTGNFIENKNIEKLNARLTELYGMNMATLKRHYKKALFNFDEESVKGGAGIGLIEMFKICKEPIEYQFTPVTDELSFLSISITI